MKLSDSALTVLKARYFIGDEDWSGLCRRVSNHVANGDEELAEEYYNAIYNQYFLPNSPALMNAGTSIGNLSACFVRSPKDSMESIMETAKEASLLFKSGGGVGMDFSKLREKDAPVKETSGVASGAVSFMEIFNTVAEVTKQGGKRRAAMMGSLRIDHPEILDFITVKNDRNKLNNFNLSVAITDDFMGKVKDNEYYDLISPHSGDIIGQLKAGDIFDFIALNAHKHGEPGLLFIDEMNKRNPIPQFGKIETTNPCLTGDTLVAVADGRNFVSIKELADIGDDVPVWSMDYEGNPVVRTMVRPRVTGHNKKIYKITFDNGQTVRATGNHQFRCVDNKYREVSELKVGDKMFAQCGQIGKADSDELNSLKKHNDVDRIVKECEFCSKTLTLNYNDREIAYCSSFCGEKMSELNKFLLSQSSPESNSLSIVSIEEDGYANVYNGTVDEFHNFYVAFPEDINDPLSNLLCINGLQCGEIPAIDGSACVLSSLNISNIDTINNLDKYVRLAVRFLNGIIEVGTFPVSKITEVAKTTRQIGLGIMGWADYLAQRGIVYGSNEAIFEANRLISRIKQIAHDESVMIAIEKNEFIDTIDGKRYNGTLLSIAPTGTISMIADCSSSIEPYFALAYNKNVMDGESFTYLNEYLERDLRKLNLWTKDIVNDIVSTGSIQHIKVIPEHIRAIYRTANEISIEEHIKMQAAFQNHVCQAVSKTINLKQGAGIQDVKDAYLLAYELGCKGITVYRDGSRGNQVLTTKQTQSEVCPDCNSELVIDGGCRTCKQCGWSACNI